MNNSHTITGFENDNSNKFSTIVQDEPLYQHDMSTINYVPYNKELVSYNQQQKNISDTMNNDIINNDLYGHVLNNIESSNITNMYMIFLATVLIILLILKYKNK